MWRRVRQRKTIGGRLRGLRLGLVLLSGLRQRLGLVLGLLGLRGLLVREDPAAVDEGFWAHYWLWTHALTIHSGTSEIQRNIVAERILGLPVSR